MAFIIIIPGIFILSQEERSSFLSRDGDEADDSSSRAGLYSTTITKPVSSISPSSTLKTTEKQPASFLLSDVVTRGSSSLNTTYRYNREIHRILIISHSHPIKRMALDGNFIIWHHRTQIILDP